MYCCCCTLYRAEALTKTLETIKKGQRLYLCSHSNASHNDGYSTTQFILKGQVMMSPRIHLSSTRIFHLPSARFAFSRSPCSLLKNSTCAIFSMRVPFQFFRKGFKLIFEFDGIKLKNQICSTVFLQLVVYEFISMSLEEILRPYVHQKRQSNIFSEALCPDMGASVVKKI